MTESSYPDDEGVLQFFGKIDHQNYREFRVREADLADITSERSVNGLVQSGLKRQNDYHTKRIFELEYELRFHQQMKKNWNLFEKVANEANMEIVARLLLSNPEIIKQFEILNFSNDSCWTKFIKAKNSAEMKEAISKVRRFGENQKNASHNSAQKREVDRTPTVSMSASTVCEDTSPTLEKLELTVRELSDEQKRRLCHNGSAISGTLEKENCAPRQELENTSTSSDTAKECEEQEKKDDEQIEKWSETTSLDPRLGNTDTCCSSLGSSEFGEVDEELNLPRSTEEETLRPAAKDDKKTAGNTSTKKSSGNKGKGKKGRKTNKGPKMTLEEIEAIKKQKKNALDKAFEEREGEMQAHMKRVENSDRQRIHRRLAETALEMLKRGNGVLPPEIEVLNEKFEDFVHESEYGGRYRLKEEYMATRIVEVSESLIGAEKNHKMNLINMFKEVNDRTELLLPYLAFSITLHDTNPVFKDFEIRVLALYLNGVDDEIDMSDPAQAEKYDDYELFRRECYASLPGPEKWSMAKENVLFRLTALRERDRERELNQEEKFLRETYLGINNLMEAYSQCNNVAAFLQTFKQHASFELMEAWFLESRKPPPLVREVTYD